MKPILQNQLPLLKHYLPGISAALFFVFVSLNAGAVCVTPVTHTFTLCWGQSVTVGTHTYRTTGTYTDRLYGAAVGGCDSVITTKLTVLFANGGAAAFGTAANYALSAAPQLGGITTDLNNDGNLDLIAPNTASTTVAVFLGNGSGSFSTATNFTVGTKPHGIAGGDFNRDGNADIAVANYGSNNLSILLGNGSGGFGSATNYTLTTGPTNVTSADFNGDGILDLAVGTTTTTVFVLLGNGNGTFSTPASTYSSAGASNYITSADFNKDGKMDLALTCYGANQVSILLGNGSGGFSSATNFATGGYPSGISAADFNADGNLDLVVANSSSTTFSILLGNGSGGFATHVDFPTQAGGNPYTIVPGDFNGDGKLDVVVTNYYSNNVAVYLGNGSGSFGTATTFGLGTGTNPEQVIAGDFNNDGTIDVATVNTGSTGVTVLLNSVQSALAGVTASSCTSGSNNAIIFTGAPAGMNSYSWAGPNGFSSAVQTPPSISPPTTAAAGVYTLSTTATNGCTYSSMATAVVNSPVTTNQTVTVCGGLKVGNTYHSATGNYTDVLTSFKGCDSTVNTNLTVNNTVMQTQSLSICAGQSVTAGGHTYAYSGTYTDKLSGAAADGCDSVVTTNLNVYFVAGGAPAFSTAVPYTPVGAPALGGIAVDLNNDGKADLIVPNSNSTTIAVFLGNGSGGFGAATTFTVGTKPTGIVSGDFNGDGKTDLAVANYTSNNVSILLGNGSGGFGSATNYTLGNNPTRVVSADFNGDGVPDLAVGTASATVYVLLGNGDGTFGTASTYSSFGAGNYMVTADFNKDGKMDLALTSYASTYALSVLLGNGSGGFGSATNFTTGSYPTGISAADFNADGNLDLVITNSSSNTFSIFLGNGSGGFGAKTDFAAGSNPYAIASADFNGDGKLDVVVANYYGSNVLVFLGNGSGSFATPASTFGTGTNPEQVIVADFNNDGKADIATANITGDNVSVLLNTIASNTSAGVTTPVCTSGSGSTLNLTGLPSGMATYNWTGPNSYTSSSQNAVINSPTTAVAGVYTLTAIDSYGCSATGSSSPVVVNSPVTTNQTVTICGGLKVGNVFHSATGNYTDVLTSSKGCDSTVNTNLTVITVVTKTQSFSICAGQSVTAGGHTYTYTGTYTDRLIGAAAGGCDSVVTTNLNVYFVAGGAPAFSTAVPYSPVSGPMLGGITADFNNDGNLDLVAPNTSSGTVALFLGNGSGGFGSATTFTVGTQPNGIVSGDFNQDGKTDIAVANYGSNNLSVLLGNGSGGFGSATNYPLGNNPSNVTSADFNGDGIPDLAVGTETTVIYVLLGNGNGTFGTTPTTYTAAGATNYIISADFNKDGKMDLALGSHATNQLSVLLGNGSGGFGSTTNFATGGYPTGIAAADFNADGNLDLVMANASSNTFSIFIGNGSGGFATHVDFPAGSNPYTIIPADFNGDGKLDVVVSNYYDNNVGVYFGNGSGSFSTPATTFGLGTGVNPEQTIVQDFNKDGKADIATVNTTSGNITVLLNTIAFNTSAGVTTPVCTSGSGSTLNLAGLPSGMSTYSWTGPNSYTSSSQNAVINSPTTVVAGVYTLTAIDSYGCSATGSSIAVVVNSPVITNQTVAVCGGLKVGNAYHTVSGNYTDVLTSSKGCDSTVNTNLTVNSTVMQTQSLSICAGQSVMVGSHTYTYTGTYTDRLSGAAANGCDSVVTTNLNVYFVAGGAPAFSTAVPYTPVGAPALGGIAVDLNNDGKADLIVPNSNSTTIAVFLGNGSGGFGAATTFTVGTKPTGIVSGDFNGDGKTDLAVANYTSNNVSILLGNGSGGFGSATNYTLGNNPTRVVSADFNGDGVPDLAVGTASATVYVLLGKGDGTFGTASTYSSFGAGNYMVTADFNKDGKMDLALTSYASTYALSVLLGNGSGGFGSATNFTTGSYPAGISAADFNADGNLDLVITNSVSNSFSIFLGNGSGGFGAKTDFAAGSNPYAIASADFNGDGKLDVVVANYYGSNVLVFLGNGSGSFATPASTFGTGTNPEQVIVADFNNDGKADIATANITGDNVSVLLNTIASNASAGVTTPVCTSGSGSTLNLTGLPSAMATYSWTGPNSYTSSTQNAVIASPTTAAAGIYTLKVTDSHGCTASGSSPAVVVNSPVITNQTVAVCGGLKVGNVFHTATGNYTDVLTSSKGCDSTVNTNLTIKPLSTMTQSLTMCAGQTVTVGGHIHTFSGTFTDRLFMAAANGCDSIVTTNLNVFFNTTNTPTFGTVVSYGTLNNPQIGGISADVNNDGKADLIVPNSNTTTTTIAVFLGNGSGGFGTATNFTVGTTPTGIVSGDFNGDGKTDLAVANYNSNNVSILLGNGAGGFGAATNYALGNNPNRVVSADFNGDGIPDLAVGTNSATVYVLLGNGNGTFSTPASTYSSAGGGNYMVTADFNKDGKMDLALTSNSPYTLSVLLGNGSGGFGSATNLTTGSWPAGISAADFNADGNLDLVITNSVSNTFSIFLGNGSGGFGAKTDFAAGSNPYAITSADFNGDGKLDVAVANYYGSNVLVFLGNGSGSFATPASTFGTGTNPEQVIAADFNNDGKADIATVNITSNNVSVLLNTVPTVFPTITATATPSSICLNDNTTLAGSGGVTYSWAPSSGLTLTTGTSVTASPAVNTTYTVTGADVHGCTSTGTTTVTLKTPVPLTVNPQSAVCTGQTNAVLTASGAATYVWAPTGNLTPSAGTSSTETAQISQLTFYTVTGTGSDGCTANTVIPVATVATGGAISPAFSIICSGGTNTLTVTGAAGHDYQWQISTDDATWTNITGATNTTYTTASGDGNSNKFYRLMAQSNSCWNVASTTGEVDVSNPNIVVTATNVTDNSLTLNWSPTGTGNYSISYSGPSSATTTSVTPPKTITGLSSDGTYSVTVTQTGVTGCPASGTITGEDILCAMPTGVTLSSPAPAQIQVSWTGTPGADYRVYYRPLFSYTTYFTKDVSNASSVLLTKQGANNIYASTTYEVYVSRLDCPTTGVVGQGTNPTNVTTLPTVTCATPVIDSVRSLCPVQIEVFIHDNGVNQYNVFLQRVTPSILAVNSYGVSGTYFTINTPYSGDQYIIAVEARCGSALSSVYVYPGNVTVKPLCNAPTNLVLSNPTCHGFTASWNSDECLSNSASAYDFYLREAGTINYNSYGVPLPGNGIGPHELLNFLAAGRTYQVFVRSVYNCNGFVTYGPTSQVETTTTLSSGCRDEDAEQPQENKPATQQYAPDNSEVFSLYPNPNTGKFVVDLSRLNMEEDAVRIEVINMLGQTVLTNLTTISGGQMSEYVNLPNGTSAGTYIVRLTAGKNVYTAKINISK